MVCKWSPLPKKLCWRGKRRWCSFYPTKMGTIHGWIIFGIGVLVANFGGNIEFCLWLLQGLWGKIASETDKQNARNAVQKIFPKIRRFRYMVFVLALAPTFESRLARKSPAMKQYYPAASSCRYDILFFGWAEWLWRVWIYGEAPFAEDKFTRACSR